MNKPVILNARDGKCPINLIFGNNGSSVIKHLWNWTSKVVGCKILIGLTVLENASLQSSFAKHISACKNIY